MSLDAYNLEFINFDWFNIFTNFMWEDMLVVFFLYNFLKYIILCTMNELIWPTHFFNRKHSNAVSIVRFRTYVEYILKLDDSSDEFETLYWSLLFSLLNYYTISFFDIPREDDGSAKVNWVNNIELYWAGAPYWWYKWFYESRF